MPTFSEELQVAEFGTFPVIDLTKNKTKGYGIFNSFTELSSLSPSIRSVGYLAIITDGVTVTMLLHNGASITDWTVDDFITILETTVGENTAALGGTEDSFFIEGEIILGFTRSFTGEVLSFGAISPSYIVPYHGPTAEYAIPIVETFAESDYTTLKQVGFHAKSLPNAIVNDTTTELTSCKWKCSAYIGDFLYQGDYAAGAATIPTPVLDQASAVAFRDATWTASVGDPVYDWLISFPKGSRTNSYILYGYNPTGGTFSYSGYKPWLITGDPTSDAEWTNPNNWTELGGAPIQIGFTTTDAVVANSVQSGLGPFGNCMPPYGLTTNINYSDGLLAQNLLSNGVITNLGDLSNTHLVLTFNSEMYGYLDEWNFYNNNFNFIPIPKVKYRGLLSYSL